MIFQKNSVEIYLESLLRVVKISINLGTGVRVGVAMYICPKDSIMNTNIYKMALDRELDHTVRIVNKITNSR